MALESGIGWTNDTVNPWIGCTELPGDPACASCYAREHRAAKALDVKWGVGEVRHRTKGAPAQLAASRRLAIAERRVRLVFTDSLCDFGDPEVDPDWRTEWWARMRAAPELFFLILTKRPNALAKQLPSDWGAGYPNVGLGISASRLKEFLQRARILARTPAAFRFFSLEPYTEAFHDALHSQLTGRSQNDLTGSERPFDWVILGGLSGPSFTAPPPVADVRAVRDACRAAEVDFTFKQWGGPKPLSNGCDLDGRTHLERPRKIRAYARETFGWETA